MKAFQDQINNANAREGINGNKKERKILNRRKFLMNRKKFLTAIIG